VVLVEGGREGEGGRERWTWWGEGGIDSFFSFFVNCFCKKIFIYVSKFV
jgi:hypothetical protein